MSKKYRVRTYDQKVCDDLRRQNKNLTNKLYRRRKKLKSQGLSPADIEKSPEVISILKQKGELKIEIWSCSKEFFDLKKQRKSVYDKIRYRTKRLDQADLSANQKAELNREIKSLTADLNNIEHKQFYGSARYKTIYSNMKRLKQLTDKLYKEFWKRKKEYLDNDQQMPDSERMRYVTQIKELGEEYMVLEEGLDQDDLDNLMPDRPEPIFNPEEKSVEVFETIYGYRDEYDTAISTGKYDTIIVQGVNGEEQIFRYPDDLILLEGALAIFDTEFGWFASGVVVSVKRSDNDNTLSITIFDNPDEENEENE